MKWILFLGCISSFLAGAAPSPQQSPASLHEPERYLFLVETSAAMRRLDQTSRQALFDLVYWGGDGHMEGGDTYGIWTFNDDVYSGIFPMQVWDPDQQLVLGTRASLFLKEQPYEKKTQMSHVVLKLLAIVMSVKDVNVFLITDGNESLVGLPVDKKITAECEKRSKEARRTKKPFIITLIARNGDITDCSVTLPGEQIKLPARRPYIPAVVAAPNPPSRSATTNVAANASPAKPLGQVISVRAVDPEETLIPDGENKSVAAPPTPADVQPSPPKRIIASSPTAPRHEVEPAGSGAVVTSRALVASSSSPVTVAAREPVTAAPLVAVSAPIIQPIITARELFVAGALLLLAAFGLIILLLRRARSPAHGSYITRSMNDRP